MVGWGVLERLRIQNFRLLRDVDIHFEDGVPTVFIGPNGSGKSTVLEALSFLSTCASEGLQAASQAHGGLHGIRTIGAKEPVVFETSWRFSMLLEAGMRNWNLDWGLAISPEPTGVVRVIRESLLDRTSGAPSVLVSTDELGVRSVFPKGDPGAKPSHVKSSAKLAFEELHDQDRFEGLFNLGMMLSLINVLGALSTAPSWARADHATVSPRDSLVLAPQSTLERQGVGLANALFSLFNDHHDTWLDLERAFKGEFPFSKRIVFPPDSGGSKISFALEDERFPGRKVLASEMSDGMIAYLCLLYAVLNPEQGGILALDEPDAYLHPSALRRLLALAHRSDAKRRIAIVTHSNALLDELSNPTDSIRIVESTRTGARIRKLDKEALAAWRRDYAVSDLRKTGLLDSTNSSYGTDE